MQQLGELVISTGADALSVEELADALIVLAETKAKKSRGKRRRPSRSSRTRHCTSNSPTSARKSGKNGEWRVRFRIKPQPRMGRPPASSTPNADRFGAISVHVAQGLLRSKRRPIAISLSGFSVKPGAVKGRRSKHQILRPDRVTIHTSCDLTFCRPKPLNWQSWKRVASKPLLLDDLLQPVGDERRPSRRFEGH